MRQEREWNQTELAYHAGLAPSVISQIENGKRNPSARTLRKLAQALGVEVMDLFPKVQSPLPDQEQWRPSLRNWIDFAGRTADRWEEEIEEREAEWRAAKPHIRRNVKWLPNLSWATEILSTYANLLEAASTELNRGLYVYETAEVQELFKNTQRLEEIVERTKPWYQGEEAPRLAEVIDLQQAMAERVAQITTRSSQSA
jgi:transcriptional regulator with XRE-family HTH domain